MFCPAGLINPAALEGPAPQTTRIVHRLLSLYCVFSADSFFDETFLFIASGACTVNQTIDRPYEMLIHENLQLELPIHGYSRIADTQDYQNPGVKPSAVMAGSGSLAVLNLQAFRRFKAFSCNWPTRRSVVPSLQMMITF